MIDDTVVTRKNFNNEIDSNEVYRKYRSARIRFANELRAIEKEYISAHYSFKEGDIVRFRNIDYKTPTLVYIERIFFAGKDEYSKYKTPRVEVSGIEVDEEGYLIPFIKGTSKPIKDGFYADDVIEVTNIQYKGLR